MAFGAAYALHRPGDAASESGMRQATTTSQIIHARFRTSASTMANVCVDEKPSEPASQPCTPFVAGHGIEADVGCHAVEPRTKWRSFYEALPIAPRAEKRVLHGIFGVVEGTEHAIAVDEQLTTMAASEMVESLFVTARIAAVSAVDSTDPDGI
jgi:hypothetical protein